MELIILLAAATAIVFIVYREKRHEVNKRSEIMMKALETGADISTETIKKLADSLRESRENELPFLNRRLLYGTVMTILGSLMFIITMLVIVQRLIRDSDNFYFGDNLLVSLSIVAACIAIGVGNLVVFRVMHKQQKEKENTVADTARDDTEDVAAE